MRPIIPSILIALCTSGAVANSDLTLTVTVDSATPNTGQIIETLFDSEDAYMKEPFAERITAVDKYGDARMTFERVTAGEYAVSSIYDDDSDGKLDTNFLGITKEKIGFSNNAKPRLGPAPYEKARFTLSPQATNIRISLKPVKHD